MTSDAQRCTIERVPYDVTCTQLAVRASEIRSVVGRATAFLDRTVRLDGAWSDFPTHSSGESTSWITAHVLVSAWEALETNLRTAAVKALKADRREPGVWGFSPSTPPDFDSTVHAVAALQRAGEAPSRSTIEVLLQHQGPGGGFRTYADASTLSTYRRGKADANYSGWTSEHVCVTAMAVNFLQGVEGFPTHALDSARNYLLTQQHPLGYWDSYWWVSPHWPTAALLCALAEEKTPSTLGDAADRGVRWIRSTVTPDGAWSDRASHPRGSILPTALATRALIAYGSDDSMIDIAVRWLLDRQKGDGSWAGRPSLCIPPPSCVAPSDIVWRPGRGVGSKCVDERRNYSTALVVRTLLDYLGEHAQ